MNQHHSVPNSSPADATDANPLPETLPVLTVIVPVYNEAGTVDELLGQVFAAPYDKQVIVVNDCSTDGTAAALRKWELRPGVEVLHHDKNRGKGTAIRTGLEYAQGQFTIIQDAPVADRLEALDD